MADQHSQPHDDDINMTDADETAPRIPSTNIASTTDTTDNPAPQQNHPSQQHPQDLPHRNANIPTPHTDTTMRDDRALQIEDMKAWSESFKVRKVLHRDILPLLARGGDKQLEISMKNLELGREVGKKSER